MSYQRACAECTTLFTALGNRAKYCSRPCSGRAERKRLPGTDAARHKRWVVANRGRVNEYGRAYYEQHATKHREQVLNWRDRNPQARSEERHRRRARIAGTTSRPVSRRDWLRLCQRFNNTCAYCAKQGKLTQDHVVPISRGGRHAIGNLLPACQSCNSSKGSKLLVEWRRGRVATD